ADARFIGAWNNDVGIGQLYEALFLVRNDRQDSLWTLTTDTEKSAKESLAARASGDPDWDKSKLTCGCVAGAPRQPTESEAASQLLDAVVRARAHHQFPGPPYIAGLLTIDELANIVGAI